MIINKDVIDWFRLIIIVGAIVLLGIVSFILTGIIYAEAYVEKNVTFAIPSHSVVFCVFGNPEKGNPVCNMFETKGKNMDDLSDFMEAFLDDRVTRSYEIN